MRVKIKPTSKPIKKYILLSFGDIDLDISFVITFTTSGLVL